MVANNCNGACAHKVAILALIIPRRATKGLYDDLPTMWVKTMSAILIRQHTCTSNCINNPRHTVHNNQGDYTGTKHDQSDSDSSLVNSASPSLSSSPPLGKLTRGSTSLPLRILCADLQWLKWIQQNEPRGQHSLV